MLFAIFFTDKPGTGDLRAQHLAAHCAWLEEHKDLVPIAGSLREEPGGPPRGGLWVAQADSKAQLHALIETDPFYRAGLRQSYEILHWSKANEQRQALI
jgi:uncharacterized protein YciI